MIVKSFKELEQYLPTLKIKDGDDRINDILQTTEDKIRDKITGADIIQPTDKILITLLHRAIALSAYLIAIPELDLQLSEAGFTVSSNEATTPASRLRVDAHIHSIKTRESEALDALVENLMTNKDWLNTSQAAYLHSGLIPSFTCFSTHFVNGILNEKLIPLTFWELFSFTPKLLTGLMMKVSPLVSRDYIMELEAKILALEELSPDEIIVLNNIRVATISYALGDIKTADLYSAGARTYMLANLSAFPTFASSDVAKVNTPIMSDNPIQSFI